MIRFLSVVSAAALSTAAMSTAAVAADSGWLTRAPLPSARFGHLAVLQPDGTVLVAGGTGGTGDVLASDAYDFRRNTWLGHAAMQFSHTVSGGFILLPLAKGHVLALSPNLAGGSASEEYDPALGAWHAIPKLPDERSQFNAVVLANGNVLVVGGTPSLLSGTSLASCLLYHPTTATWTATGSLATSRLTFSLTLLPNGRVLAGGGLSLTEGGGEVLASCESYVPVLGAWRPAGELLVPRLGQFCLLASGNVLAAAGTIGTPEEDLGSSEEFTPQDKASHATNSCTVPSGAAFTPLRGGALRAGGVIDLVNGDSTTAVDVFSSASHAWSAAPALQVARQQAAAVTLPSGEVLVLGGTSTGEHSGYTPLASSELYVMKPSFAHAEEAAGGTVGRAFSYQVDAATVATYTAVGLPPGITLNQVTGHLGGRPTTAGTYRARLGATDAYGHAAMYLTLTIAAAPAPAPGAPQGDG